MLNEAGFDLWADGYDKSVGLSDESSSYPFAGYKIVLDKIYNDILSCGHQTILDLGFGTAVLTARLYEQGCTVFGQDFSGRMIELAQEKMPSARLFQGDFSKGLAEPLMHRQYDAILATYSLHHLTDDQKLDMLRSLLSLLSENGRIYIGDVAFASRAKLEECKRAAQEQWDTEEIYFVYDELRQSLPQLEFEQCSFCAGILSLSREK